jgi:DNA-binding MarR family transcriptional regulator
MSAARTTTPDTAVDQIDTQFLESLVGYNTRRATLVIIGAFMERMAEFDLRPVDFSVASLIVHNPGITSRQLCTALGLLPPNLVGLLNALEKRGLISRRPHPNDGRAMGLHPTAAGTKLMKQAEKVAFDLEAESSSALTATERKTLIRLLQKVYLKSA